MNGLQQSFLPTTFCYRLLEDYTDFLTAKFACQKQRSILLEFDTRAEVDDFLLLVEDEHLGLTGEERLWLGAVASPGNNSFTYQVLCSAFFYI